MSVVGVLTGGTGEPDDGVAVDADEPPGGADAAPLVEVLEDGQGLLLGEVAAVQRGALPLGEAGPAGVAVELAELLVLAEATADREVAGVAPAVERAVRVLAAEVGEVVHEADRAGQKGTDASR
ncbi:MAG TPA: hypothetical protein VKE74_18055 [Gemmataceae bacterium]|nr:hypothetical protein [Gemmataceae bacterium]